MQPSDFPAPFGRDFGSPCQRPTSMQELVLGRPRVRLPTRSASETDHRLSVKPETPEERQGPPGLLGRPLRACRGALAACRLLPHFGPDLSLPLLPFEKIHGEDVIAFTQNRTLGIRNGIAFEAKYPRPTRSRAYASPIPLPRPSQGSLPARAGSTLAGRDSHPLDGESKFHEVIASFNPNRPAGPGRTGVPSRTSPA